MLRNEGDKHLDLPKPTIFHLETLNKSPNTPAHGSLFLLQPSADLYRKNTLQKETLTEEITKIFLEKIEFQMFPM